MLAILSLAMVLSLTNWFSAIVIIPELKVVWSLHDSTVTWLTNAVQIGFVFGALSAGFFNLPDIISARILMGCAALLAAAANLALLVAGTVSDLYSPASKHLILLFDQPSQRGYLGTLEHVHSSWNRNSESERALNLCFRV